MEIHGQNEIGFAWSAKGERINRAVNPLTGQILPGEFREATAEEMSRACAKAEAAFPVFADLPGRTRADFLDAIIECIEERNVDLMSRVALETGYPEARILSERDRTLGQLRRFAELLREGSWMDARIDRGDPARKPLPKPDLRRRLVALGPVAVFGSSNFPQAFSTAGGDTASALAAGCPVIVKTHPAHPGVSEIYAGAILAAARRTGMPDGVFSRLNGGAETGAALVRDPRIRAVAFTGSYRAAKALMETAAARPVPIPVYAEMGSTNPVFLLPEALDSRRAALVEAWIQSLTLGGGQFCTCPGLLVLRKGPDAEAFLAEAIARLGNLPVPSMVHSGVKRSYDEAVERRSHIPHADLAMRNRARGAHLDTDAQPALFRASAAAFLEDPELAEEIFGPSALVVIADGDDDFLRVAASLPGQLTATVHGSEGELARFSRLFNVLEQKAGRLIVNGFPTGVEVCPSMQHGGPWPAASTVHTSVGTAAIHRFTRPVCYQDFPAALLPPELQDGNPLGIWRLVDGAFTRDL